MVPTSLEIDLVSDTFAKWKDWAMEPNDRVIDEPWALLITGPDPQYKVEGDWLPKEDIDGDVHFDVSSLQEGDLVKIADSSMEESNHTYWEVDSVGDTLDLSRISEVGVENRLEDSDPGGDFLI